MTGICWWLVDRLRERWRPMNGTRCTGIFAESGETGGRALHGVFGLVVGRQAALWKNRRP
jgi:hypothetical protein